MRDLGKALGDIAAIRDQMAQTSQFRGYGPTTLAATAALAVSAAVVQARYIPDPANDVTAYLALWIATAALSVALIGVEVVTRSRRIHSGLADEMIRLAAEKQLPAIAAGALLTAVLARTAPHTLWLLPGLWQILLSLGMFAASSSVPRPLIAVGFWYMASGLTCIALANGGHAFSPLAMGVPFGLGQLLAAALLRRVEGSDEEN
ncbi:MAG: hypothetical protein F8N15_08760 [Methanobacterium sp.]|nr:hypothetical protein [Methanobacterium sp.]